MLKQLFLSLSVPNMLCENRQADMYEILYRMFQKKTIPKRYKNKRHKSLLVLHVCARYKDDYIIILGANII